MPLGMRPLAKKQSTPNRDLPDPDLQLLWELATVDDEYYICRSVSPPRNIGHVSITSLAGDMCIGPVAKVV